MALSQEFRERSQDTSVLQGAPKMPSGMLRAEDVEAVHLRALANDVEMDAHNRTVQVLSQSTGMDASNVLGGFRARTGAEAAMQANLRSDEKKKSDTDAVAFLALLDAGDLDYFIADEIFGGMSDVEVAEFVAKIEAETGQDFMEYAEDVLGEGAIPDRLPGEDDIDYQRRLLVAIGDEVLNDDLSIKPEYGYDPVARFVRDHEVTTHARQMTQEADRIKQEIGTQAAIDHVSPEAGKSYSTSKEIGNASTVSEVSGFGYESADGHRDTEANEEASDTLDFLSGSFGSDSAMQNAKDNLEKQFQQATADKSSFEAPNNSPRFEPDLGNV